MLALASSPVLAQDDTYNIDGDMNQDVSTNATSEASAANGVSSVDLTFEGSDIPPYMPNTIAAPVVSPTLFNLMGKPAQIAGLPVLSRYFFSTAYRDVDLGESGATKVIFNSAKIEKRESNEGRRVKFDFNGRANGRVIGSLTVQSKKQKGDEVDLPSVIYDATQYISCQETLKGYDVLLLSAPELISYSVGVDANSKGVSMSPVVSGLINGPLGALTGLASGYSNTGGVTVPTALVGCTFLVVLEEGEKYPIDLGTCFGRSGNGEGGDGEGNGTKRKQYESTK